MELASVGLVRFQVFDAKSARTGQPMVPSSNFAVALVQIAVGTTTPRAVVGVVGDGESNAFHRTGMGLDDIEPEGSVWSRSDDRAADQAALPPPAQAVLPIVPAARGESWCVPPRRSSGRRSPRASAPRPAPPRTGPPSRTARETVLSTVRLETASLHRHRPPVHRRCGDPALPPGSQRQPAELSR